MAFLLIDWLTQRKSFAADTLLPFVMCSAALQQSLQAKRRSRRNSLALDMLSSAVLTPASTAPLRVQPLPAAELHRLTGNDAADGSSDEKVIQNIERNVPSGTH